MPPALLAEGPSEDTVAESRAGGPLDFAAAQAELVGRCGDCHSGEITEGEFSLTPLGSAESLVTDHDRWMQVRARLADGSMPPADAQPLDPADRVRLIEWLDGAVRAAFARRGESAGPPQVRRLAAHEYSNTIRDLMEVHIDAGHALPQDVAGGEGFNNAAETLTISPIHAEKYLEAATDALAYAANDSTARARLVPQRPSQQMSATEAARANLTAFVGRAFRRPIDPGEAEPYVRLFSDAQRDGLNFDAASCFALRAVLASPDFLFLCESPPSAENVTEPLAPWELASRLSYFLWASMPDQSLREAADTGRLIDPQELRSQTLRMLSEGTRLNDSLVEFVGQWLGTADLGRSKQVDPLRHPWIQDSHVAALRHQPVSVMETIVRENRSLTELIDSDWTVLNEELLQVYQLDRAKLDPQEFNQNLKFTRLPQEYRRHSGVVSAGGAMVLTAYPHRTSPVLRGVWVLDKMLGVKLPPPPPSIPKLDESPQTAKSQTLRERFEQHRADPACAGCHDRIDPIGFALENFDELGRWRQNEGGGPVDSVAQLPGGREIDGVAGIKRYLLENKLQFIRHLTEKMLGYALARGLRPADQATVELIVARLEENDFRAQELLLGVVESKPFRFKGGDP